MVSNLDEYVDKVRKKWEEGRWEGYETLQNLFTFNEYVKRVEEFCIEKREGSEPSISVNITFKESFRIDEKKLLYWYLLSKAKRKAITIHYDIKFFEAEVNEGIIDKGKIAEMEFTNQRRTYLVYRNHFVDFIEDLERKDPDPAKIFLRLIAGGVNLKEKEEEFVICERLANELKMNIIKSRGGKEVKGGWFKPYPSKMIDEFLYCVKELNGSNFTVEFRQIEFNKIPRLGNVLGIKLEYPTKSYRNYHIWLSNKMMNAFLSIYDDEIKLLKDILAHIGVKEE